MLESIIASMPTIGTHRVRHTDLEDGVWITGGAGGFEIRESQYVSIGYWPALDSLPWGDSVPGGGID